MTDSVQLLASFGTGAQTRLGIKCPLFPQPAARHKSTGPPATRTTRVKLTGNLTRRNETFTVRESILTNGVLNVPLFAKF
jgi:hypothetical protein